jgi:hypothetical protein
VLKNRQVVLVRTFKKSSITLKTQTDQLTLVFCLNF